MNIPKDVTQQINKFLDSERAGGMPHYPSLASIQWINKNKRALKRHPLESTLKRMCAWFGLEGATEWENWTGPDIWQVIEEGAYTIWDDKPTDF